MIDWNPIWPSNKKTDMDPTFSLNRIRSERSIATQRELNSNIYVIPRYIIYFWVAPWQLRLCYDMVRISTFGQYDYTEQMARFWFRIKMFRLGPSPTAVRHVSLLVSQTPFWSLKWENQGIKSYIWHWFMIHVVRVCLMSNKTLGQIYIYILFDDAMQLSTII